MSGLDVKQFKDLVRASLVGFGGTADAVNLVTGTCMVESGLQYLRQINGPAMGVGQMEPATFNDIRDRYLPQYPSLAQKVTGAFGSGLTADRLVWDLKLAIVFTRLKYMSDPYTIPSNAADLALYHKRVYNTYRGKADANKNTPVFQAAINA